MSSALVLTTVNAPYSKQLNAHELAGCLRDQVVAKAFPGAGGSAYQQQEWVRAAAPGTVPSPVPGRGQLGPSTTRMGEGPRNRRAPSPDRASSNAAAALSHEGRGQRDMRLRSSTQLM